MGKPLVIVESPAKARTIGKFLGKAYIVEASIGHVRDLPESASDIPEEYKKLKWARTGVDVDNDFRPLYVLTDRGKDQVKKLKALLKEASEVFLATDEDREGEAIAWHLLEVLRPKVPVRRLVFHEITQKAIDSALKSPRSLSLDLVKAQETRRIVDRLYGYTVSPVLWRKVRPKLSAGRVQSTAVRLVVERERARMRFKSAEYWDIDAALRSAKGDYKARLVELDGKRIVSGRDFDPETGQLRADVKRDVVLLDEPTAKGLAAASASVTGQVRDATRKEFREKPAPPFITSTLQQEANRKLRWSARRTMNAAQRLYENGWITYMRTDSTSLSDDAVRTIRSLVTEKYGKDYLPEQPRAYRTTSKGAQEAHEAIRPAGDVFRTLEEARRELGGDEARLYELIWKRAVACQMADARGVRMTVDTDVTALGKRLTFRASGRAYTFAGYRQAYIEDVDQGDAEPDEDGDGLLPDLHRGDQAQVKSAQANGHTTQPPARLTDATLIKELEARGIGRPSTYATIIETVESRGYVFKKGTALVPTWTAFAVTNLMEHHFDRLVDYDFTAGLEGGLDQIASGQLEQVQYLRKFYSGEAQDVLGLVQLVDKAQADVDPRDICAIPLGMVEGIQVVARVGRFGPFIEYDGRTKSIPDDLSPDELSPERAVLLLSEAAEGPKELGTDPVSGLEVTLHKGRFGPYVQLGAQEEGSKTKPKRESLLPGMVFDDVDLSTALALLSLPRNVGPDSAGNPIMAHNGRFGPYIKAGEETRTLPPPLTPLSVTHAQALELLAQPRRRASQGAPAVMREVGRDPDGRTIVIKQGRFGPYATDGEVNATIPKSANPESISIEAICEMLAAKRSAEPSTKPKRGAGRGRPGAAKTAAKKADADGEKATKKAPAKKAASAKAAPKKATKKPTKE